jgi:hypothetical protein
MEALNKLPKMYSTENVPLNDKMVITVGYLAKMFWLIAEYDPKTKLAFGYANLGDDQMAEWGYISIAELEEVGAKQITTEPKRFEDALNDAMSVRRGMWGF